MRIGFVEGMNKLCRVHRMWWCAADNPEKGDAIVPG
jgi:hypothetical protein